ncbi:hypothetical protein [Thiohalomonas denitrificans]|uniref:hypothetical protein n=1 Tax=Thiohalomonas denitrificans TaxID=415747 RepID=UPI0026F28681|nr:hypothetical protein [Thiohalomonas denitrificans]
MARRKERPLTTEEAKARLRYVSREIGAGPWVRRNPLAATTYAVLGGIVLGSAPNLRRSLSRAVVALLPLLMRRG